MKASSSKRFQHEYAKLPKKLRDKVDERLLLWQRDQFHPQLRNHQLTGKYADYHSINITGDLRALYLTRGNEIIFDQLGTHSQLYG
jgi:addiction module RelE/StbE family toxin